jgi:hypothetical protein
MQSPFNRIIDDSFIATFIELLHQQFALEVTAGEIRKAAAAFELASASQRKRPILSLKYSHTCSPSQSNGVPDQITL